MSAGRARATGEGLPGEDANRSAELIRAVLCDRGADVLPVPELVRATGLPRLHVLAAVARDADLGTCGSSSAPLVWMLPAPVLESGFVPQYRHGRLVMWLSGRRHGRPPLFVGGERLGPGPTDTAYAGLGELGHRVRRLGIMARRWLLTPEPEPPVTEVLHRLFELVGHTWHASHQPLWTDGALHVHESVMRRPVGRSLAGDGSPTTRLEIVTWRDRDGRHWLVNLYPTGMHCTIVDVRR